MNTIRFFGVNCSLCILALSISACRSPNAPVTSGSLPIRILKFDGISSAGVRRQISGQQTGAFECPLDFQLLGGSMSVVAVNGQINVYQTKGQKIKRVIVPVELVFKDGTTRHLHLQVDTGADATLINLNKLGLNTFQFDKVTQGHGVGDQPIQTYTANVSCLAVGDQAWQMDVQFAQLPVDLEGPESDGLLGWDFLGHYRLVIDYQDHLFRLERHEKSRSPNK